MISAISSSASAAYPSLKKSSADLETQLSRYQKQLADCISCPSYKTPAGKKKIQEISQKISGLHEQINQASSTKPDKSEATLQKSDENVSAQAVPPTTAPNQTDDSTVGRHLNVFA